MAKKNKGGGGAPDWLVTFADLMSLLVCFFVLIISFSIQDKEKLQVVAGSMKDAFGVRELNMKAGIVELDGVPTREWVKQIGKKEKINDTDFEEVRHDEKRKQGPEANTHDYEKTEIQKPRHFALAAESLRQAWQEMPEITEISDNLIMEETEEGLHIQIVDQEGRPMFTEGSKYPYEVTRRVIAKMAPVLKQLPNRIKISGHSASGTRYSNPRYGAWELSSDRANITRSILSDNGISSDQFHSVVGKADTDPLFPNDPFLASNRRLSIVIMKEAPPVPLDHTP